jgi:hypothetical protein
MQKTCVISGQDFVISEEEQTLLDQLSPVIGGTKYSLPIPDISPAERQRRRLAFRNVRYLHHRKCDFSGKTIISPYSKDTSHTVYHSDIWWSDKWDPLDYGRDFDFSRPFFEQFAELYRDVPTLHHYVIHSENCEYINGASQCKNCYLCFDIDRSEDCYYLTNAKDAKDCLDSINLKDCELCYSCVDCEKCYSLQYSERSVGCYDSMFLADCRNCKNCIGCVNLVNKEYHIFNQPVSKEEFKAYKLKLNSKKALQAFEKQWKDYVLKFPKKYYFGHSNEDFSGNNIQNIKDSQNCFDSFNLQDCHHCNFVTNSHHCMDYDLFGENSQWIYNCIATGLNCSNNICSFHIWTGSSDILYSYQMISSSNCFGSCGLRNKEYCIFNKQYSKEEYEELVPKIIEHMKKTGEWGQFFPASMSPFGYNETVADEHFPLTKDEILKQGLHWKDEDQYSSYQGPAPNIPDQISDVDDSICKEIIPCAKSSIPFKIIPQELKFYKRMNIPLPTLAPKTRYEELKERRNQQLLWDRKCQKCHAELKTSYQESQSEIVYCEACFNNELY